MPSTSAQVRLIVSFIVCSAVCVGASAQDTDPSHRKLKLPTGSNGNAQQQIQLIRQLQSLIKNRSKSNGESEGLSDAQKSLMESMLEQFKDSKNLPKLSDIPPDLLGKVLADPKAREDAAEMLKKFQKERKIPEGNGQSDLPLPTQNRRKGPGVSQKQTESTSQTPSQGQLPSPKSTDSRNRKFEPDPDQRSPSPTAKTRPKQTLPADNSRPPTRLPNESDSDYEGRFMDFLEQQIRKQRQKRQGRDPSSLDLPEIPPSPTNRPDTDRLNPRNGPAELQSPQNHSLDSGGSSELTPSISDLLKNLDSLPPVSGDPSAKKSAEQSARRQRQSEQQRAQEAARLQQGREQARRELDRGGLGSAFKKIVRDSKSQLEKESKSGKGGKSLDGRSGGQPGTSSGMSKGLQDSIIRSLDGLGKDLVDIVKDGEFKQRDRKTQGRKVESSTSRQKVPTAPRKPKPDGWSKKASEFFSDIARPPAGEVAPEAASVSPDDGASSATANVSFTPFIVLGVIVLSAILLAWNSGAISPEAILARNKDTSVPRRPLRTRKDVVEAFHQFATRSGRNVKSWWTHQQVKELVRQQEPAKQAPIEVLASVYERARYLPDESVLADDQLHAAEAALDRCRS